MNTSQVHLGIPWLLPHYKPLNGPHPLVESFLLGNAAVLPIEVRRNVPVSTAQQTSVLLGLTRQARQLPDELTGKFIDWLNIPDQALMEAQGADYRALFLHTTPLYTGSRPWIFHFESFPSLFMPFMLAGATRSMDLASPGLLQMIHDRLASADCLRIFTHMRSSLAILNRVYDDPTITAKSHHVPLGIATQPAGAALAKFEQPERLRILFTNSLHQDPRSFYLRGGHHMLAAFSRLRRSLPDIELTVLSSVPEDLLERFTPTQLVGVNWINKRVDSAALERLFLDHHFFALPSAGLHSYSMLRALAHGCVPIVSDALGYEEYTQGIEDSVLPIRGVRAMVYRQEPAGWVSDDYTPFIADSEAFVQQIHDRVLEHARPADLRTLALRNLEHCRTHFSLQASQAVFNRLLPAT
jgi:glycosyltransferase involved in cell wall biosynthesis